MESLPFRKALFMFRQRANISQARLARLCGFDHSYVSRLESGARNPSRDAVETIIDVLALNASDGDALLYAAGFIGSSGPVNDPLALQVQSLMQSPDTSDGYRMMAVQVISALVQGAR